MSLTANWLMSMEQVVASYAQLIEAATSLGRHDEAQTYVQRLSSLLSLEDEKTRALLAHVSLGSERERLAFLAPLIPAIARWLTETESPTG